MAAVTDRTLRQMDGGRVPALRKEASPSIGLCLPSGWMPGLDISTALAPTRLTQSHISLRESCGRRDREANPAGPSREIQQGGRFRRDDRPKKARCVFQFAPSRSLCATAFCTVSLATRSEWASTNTVHLTILIFWAKSIRRVRWRLRGRRL